MTQKNNPSNDSSKTMITRRNVLIGLGVTGAGTLAALDNFTDMLEGTTAPGVGSGNPPLTDPNGGSDVPAFLTPWDTDSLVVSLQWSDGDSGDAEFFENSASEELGNAVAFWNDYIEANAAFDLTLTFEQNHDNPDILLNQAQSLNHQCGPEYTGPGSQNETWSAAACLDTLRETPADGDLPVTGTIGPCGKGRGVYRLIAQHAIGRLLGYDIWSDPVSVMTPKILITPAHPHNTFLYHLPHKSDDRATTHLRDDLISRVENSGEGTRNALGTLRDQINKIVEFHNSNIDEWLADIDGLAHGDVYAEAYQETVANDEISYLEETAALISDVLDTYTQSEIADGPDELDPIQERVVTIRNWPGDSDPYDVQIHRYVTTEVWSAWAAEQTPTATATPTTTDSA